MCQINPLGVKLALCQIHLRGESGTRALCMVCQITPRPIMTYFLKYQSKLRKRQENHIFQVPTIEVDEKQLSNVKLIHMNYLWVKYFANWLIFRCGIWYLSNRISKAWVTHCSLISMIEKCDKHYITMSYQVPANNYLKARNVRSVIIWQTASDNLTS